MAHDLVCLMLTVHGFREHASPYFVNHSTATGKMLCEAMETNAVFVLVEHFKASTAGFNPLSIDWDSKEAMKLVDNDIGVSRCFRELQSLCREYCKSMFFRSE